MIINKPLPEEYPAFYETYVNKITVDDLITALNETRQQTIELVKIIPLEKEKYKYADGKWSIRELFGHMIDAEKIFAYRALRFARNDKTELAGFEEDDYVPESNAENRSLKDLTEEYLLVRDSTIAFFKGITNEMSLRSGKANGKAISVRALGYSIAGHNRHHNLVIRERYL